MIRPRTKLGEKIILLLIVFFKVTTVIEVYKLAPSQ
jgi:hypothetical protein